MQVLEPAIQLIRDGALVDAAVWLIENLGYTGEEARVTVKYWENQLKNKQFTKQQVAKKRKCLVWRSGDSGKRVEFLTPAQIIARRREDYYVEETE